jgi:hypothetical protein
MEMCSNFSISTVHDLQHDLPRTEVLRDFTGRQVGRSRASVNKFSMEGRQLREVIKADSRRVCPQVIWFRVKRETELELCHLRLWM